jgi:hypothetical protein
MEQWSGKRKMQIWVRYTETLILVLIDCYEAPQPQLTKEQNL